MSTYDEPYDDGYFKEEEEDYLYWTVVSSLFDVKGLVSQ